MLDVFPQDEFALYEAPVVYTAVSIANAPVLLAPVDPSRVVLVISVSTQPFPAGGLYYQCTTATPNAQGILVAAAPSLPIVLNYRDHGALTSYDWYVYCTVGAITVTAYGLLLRRNPQMYGYKDVFKTPSQPAANAVQVRSARRAPYRLGGQIPAGLRSRIARRIPTLFGEE